MRRSLTAMSAALVLILVLVPAVAAKGPGGHHGPKIPAGPATNVAEFDAGVTCSFAVREEEWVQHERITTRDRHGVEVTTVHFKSVFRLTNLDAPGTPWVTFAGYSTADLWEPGDGTFVIKAQGTSLFYFFPGDDTPVGVGDGGFFLVTGKATSTLDLASDVVTDFTLKGKVRDLCAEVAG